MEHRAKPHTTVFIRLQTLLGYMGDTYDVYTDDEQLEEFIEHCADVHGSESEAFKKAMRHYMNDKGGQIRDLSSKSESGEDLI